MGVKSHKNQFQLSRCIWFNVFHISVLKTISCSHVIPQWNVVSRLIKYSPEKQQQKPETAVTLGFPRQSISTTPVESEPEPRIQTGKTTLKEVSVLSFPDYMTESIPQMPERNQK